MYYAGIDAHRSYLTVAIVDASGEVVRERKRVLIGDGEPLLEALEGFRPLKAVVETCPFWPWIHDTLEPTEVGFHLAHASGVVAIAKSDVKTDEIDAGSSERKAEVGCHGTDMGGLGRPCHTVHPWRGQKASSRLVLPPPELSD